jgi:hypothetical protein
VPEGLLACDQLYPPRRCGQEKPAPCGVGGDAP